MTEEMPTNSPPCAPDSPPADAPSQPDWRLSLPPHLQPLLEPRPARPPQPHTPRALSGPARQAQRGRTPWDPTRWEQSPWQRAGHEPPTHRHDPPAQPDEIPPLAGYRCPECRDKQWLLPRLPSGKPDYGNAVRCVCQEPAYRARRTSWLLEIDGLTPRERLLRMGDLVRTPGNQAAIDGVTQALARHNGLVTLIGPPGTGKTTLLIAAVNAAREANIPAVYTSFARLLAELRAGFDAAPGSETPSFQKRWELLTSVEVLALDELDDFSATPWAVEHFHRLIDERWRWMDDRLTLLATNRPLRSFPPKVASRLQDGRAQVYTLTGHDFRPLQQRE